MSKISQLSIINTPSAGAVIPIVSDGVTRKISVTSLLAQVPEGPTGPVGPAGPQGLRGDRGPQGIAGESGATGPGVPTGGTAGQVLAKIDGANYNTQWITFQGGGTASDSFKTIAVSGQSSIVADGTTDTLTLAAGSGIQITTSESTDTITIATTGTSLASRTTVSVTTASLAQNQSANVAVTGFKGYLLYKVQTTSAAWVRIYSSTSARAADASRTIGTDPTTGAGVIAEVVATSGTTQLITPGVIGFSSEATPSTAIPMTITNTSASPSAITVTLTLVQLEA